MSKRVVRVAAGQGFWGDWLEAPRRQVEGGPIDYLMLDYLAEVTMSILQKQKERDPNAGYARDFVGAMESVLPAVMERGAQCSGGNCLYEWRSIPDLANVGYPIIEASDDGTFIVTKHPNTGGR